MKLKQGSVGTIIIGIIFILTGVTYLDNIVNSAAPIDWTKIVRQQLHDYDLKTQTIQAKKETEWITAGVSEKESAAMEAVLQKKIESGRDITFQAVKDAHNLNSQFLLLTHPIRLFVFLFVTMWLMVVGIGFLIIFPWARWFAFLSIMLNYAWVTYIFLYERNVEALFAKAGADVNKIFDIPPVPSLDWYEDPHFLMQALQTFIFIGMVMYFMSPAGKEIFKEKRVFDFNQIIKNIEVKPEQ